MRTFVMRRRFGTGGGPDCLVIEGGKERALEHRVRHSPTGLEWGYGGSGPADLARSIVAEVTGDEDPHPHLYHAVKERLVAKLPFEGGTIHEAQVRTVLAERGWEPEETPGIEGDRVLAVRPMNDHEMTLRGWKGRPPAVVEFESGAVLTSHPSEPGGLVLWMSDVPYPLRSR